MPQLSQLPAALQYVQPEAALQRSREQRIRVWAFLWPVWIRRLSSAAGRVASFIDPRRAVSMHSYWLILDTKASS